MPSISGKTLSDLYDDADGECYSDDDIYSGFAELIGRQYYVEVDTSVSPVMVTRLAQMNAAVINENYDDSRSYPIIHQNDYESELAADGTGEYTDCNTDDDYENCYAYAEAETIDTSGATADGANDMNRCFYTDTISGDAVINKFGAAATFGPTLADVFADRDGYLDRTSLNLMVGTIGMSLSITPTTFVSIFPFLKQYVDSHYFYAPSPGPYDIRTYFAFLFPFKHFMGESETIQALAIYNNSEEKQTINVGKFLSPGLPTPGTDADEAELYKLTPPYNEGWIRFAVEAANDTEDCADATLDPNLGSLLGGYCSVYGIAPDWLNASEPITTDEYMPGFTGAVFTSGSQSIGVSPFNYNRDRFLLPEIIFSLGGE
jgi:hypothetical protein